jgi:hypothetical protein
MEEEYRPLIEGLRQRSLHCYFQNPDQLVISRQRGPVFPFAGNSFWVSRHQGQWVLGTWASVCYLVPADADLASLCTEFASHGDSAQVVVPGALVARYRLAEVREDELFAEESSA